MKTSFAVFFLCLVTLCGKSQSVNKGDITLNANIGAPHLFKGIVKLATNSNIFKENFDGIIEISSIKGINPISLKAGLALDKNFTLGLNYSYWSLSFDVEDHYNAQNISYGSIYEDSVDIYKIKIASSSFGIRPVFNFPLESYKNDFYLALGLGFTKNQLTIDFSSTDAGRFVGIFNKGLAYDLSLPGGFYFAPSIGYRHYFNPFIGLNFELGYEKGAIVQGGLVFRFNYKKEVRDKQKAVKP
ncbi:MAG: hypothetical protein JNJ41_16055 [Bacteroidia bacterium]|nr:hypothetical protein [Bacteroidia bacterium]